MRTGVKLASILYSLLLFAIFINAFHEQAHQWGALAVGVPNGGGYVTFGWGVAHYYYPSGFTPSHFQHLIVNLAGGFGVALVYTVGWIIRRLSEKYTSWDLDDVFALQFVGLWQFLYAFTEIINWQYWGGGLSMLIAALVTGITYGQKLFRWLEEE